MHQILEMYNTINHFGNLNGMAFEVPQPGEVIYTMTIEEKHQSGPGVAHGGMLAAFMDSVLGVAALSVAVEDNNIVSTVEFKINFLEPARIGETITGYGKVDSKGKKIITSTGEIRDSSGNLIAKAMGTFNAYPAEKIRDKMNGMFNL
jgi:uncharacterized protein (TIGR00369 family)